MSDVSHILSDWRDPVSEFKRLVLNPLPFLSLFFYHLFGFLPPVQVIHKLLVFQHWIELFRYFCDFFLAFVIDIINDLVVDV